MFEFIDVSTLEARALNTVYAVMENPAIIRDGVVNGIVLENAVVEDNGDGEEIIRYSVSENDVAVDDVIASYTILCTVNLLDGVATDFEILFTRWIDSTGDVRSY